MIIHRLNQLANDGGNGWIERDLPLMTQYSSPLRLFLLPPHADSRSIRGLGAKKQRRGSPKWMQRTFNLTPPPLSLHSPSPHPSSSPSPPSSPPPPPLHCPRGHSSSSSFSWACPAPAPESFASAEADLSCLSWSSMAPLVAAWWGEPWWEVGWEGVSLVTDVSDVPGA